MTSNVIKIRSGGQTGADRAALDFAIKYDIPYAGWVPKGGWAEDYPNPPGILMDYPNLREVDTPTINQRTIRNVMDSDATLIMRVDNSPGSDITYETAVSFEKNVYLFLEDIKEAKAWFDSLPMGTELNIGGPRESERPGTYDETYKLLTYLFEIDEKTYEEPGNEVKSQELITVSTYTDKKTVANDIVKASLSRNIATSAHIVPVSSSYRWGGSVEETPEYQIDLICKAENKEDLVEIIKELHNYSTPALTFHNIILAK